MLPQLYTYYFNLKVSNARFRSSTQKEYDSYSENAEDKYKSQLGRKTRKQSGKGTYDRSTE